MKEAGRMEEFVRYLSDEKFQKKLFIEFGPKEA